VPNTIRLVARLLPTTIDPGSVDEILTNDARIDANE